MSTRLARAQITAQERLRAIAALGVERAWAGLRGYDEENVETFLSRAVPVVVAAQRQSVTITEAFLSRSLGRRPAGVAPSLLTGAAVRAGVEPEETYRRPFVTVWTALKEGRQYEQAVAAGLARARSTAATDVQLTQRATLDAVQRSDRTIRGWRRVADAGACEFCQKIDGAFVKSASAMALHPGCGCSLVPVETPVGPSAVPEGVSVRSHGELGPTLGSPDHDFTTEAEALA